MSATFRLLAALALGCSLAGCPEAQPEPEPGCPEGMLLDTTDSAEGVCVPEACGLGPWGNVEPGDEAVLYVAPWGSDSASGSAEDPLRDPSEAWLELVDAGGGRLVLGEGVYEDAYFLTEIDDLSVHGRCAELVELVGRPDESLVDAFFGSVELRGVTLRSALYGVNVSSPLLGSTRVELREGAIDGCVHSGLLVEGAGAVVSARDWTIRNCVESGGFSAGGVVLMSGRVELERVRVENNEQYGVVALGSESRLEFIDTEIVDTAAGEGAGVPGMGLVVQDGATASLERVSLLRNGSVGLFSSGDSEVTAIDLRVEDTYPSPDNGNGVVAQLGVDLTIDGFISRGNTEFGLWAAGAGTSVVLSDVLVEDTLPRKETGQGFAISVQEEVELVASDLVLRTSTSGGVQVLGSTAQLSNVEVYDMGPDSFGQGRAVAVSEGATVAIDGLLAEGLVAGGVVGFGAGTSLSLSDAVIRDVAPNADPEYGSAGFGLQSGASGQVDGLLIERASGVGISVVQALLTATDVEIRDTRTDLDGFFGRGIVVEDGSVATLSNALLEGNQGVGVFVNVDSSAELSDVTVRDTGTSGDLQYGNGLSVQLGSVVTATDLLVEDGVGGGVVVSAAEVSLERATIRRVAAHQESGLGSGLHVQLGGSVSATDLVVEDCTGLGVVVGTPGSELTADGVEIRGTQPTVDGLRGFALYASQEGQVELSDALLEDNLGSGIFVNDGALAVLDEVTLRRTIGGSTKAGGVGLLVQQDAELHGSSVHVEESSGPGLFLSGGLITCEGCTLEDNGFASAVALEGELVLSGGALQGSTPTPDLGGGVGLFAWSFHDLGVQLQDVEFAGHPGPAAYLRGPGSYQLDRVTVTDSAQLSLVPGAVVVLQGVEPWDPAEASGLRVLDSSFGELPVSALFFDSSGGSLEGNSFAEGPDYAVWTQSCGGAPAVEFVGPEPEHNDCQGAPRDLDPLLIYELELLEMFVLED